MSGMIEFTVYQCPVCGGLVRYAYQGLVLDGRAKRRYYVFSYACESCNYFYHMESTPETDSDYAAHQAVVDAFPKERPPFPGRR